MILLDGTLIIAVPLLMLILLFPCEWFYENVEECVLMLLIMMDHVLVH